MGEKMFKALSHIVKNGSDSNLKGKTWVNIKIELWKVGYIKRGRNWLWIPTPKGEKFVELQINRGE